MTTPIEALKLLTDEVERMVKKNFGVEE